MTKITSCPRCGSKRIKKDHQLAIWDCKKCGYQGGVVVEDGNLEKQVREARKMDKLQKKMLRGGR
jgi:ribosomal protein L37AE/L43A